MRFAAGYNPVLPNIVTWEGADDAQVVWQVQPLRVLHFANPNPSINKGIEPLEPYHSVAFGPEPMPSPLMIRR